MIYVTCRLTAKNRDRLRNPSLGNRVWATFTFFRVVCVEQMVGGVDELSPKCLELRVGRLLSFTEVRLIDRQTHGQTDGQSDTLTDRHTGRQTDIQSDTQTETDIWTDGQTDRWTTVPDRQTERWKDRHTDRWIVRYTDRQTCTHCLNRLFF